MNASQQVTNPQKQCRGWPLAVCSWSLRTDAAGVLAAVRELGLDRLNLALKPALADGGELYLDTMCRAGLAISATTIGFPQEDYSTLESIRATGGIVPDAYWPQNRQRVERAVAITADLKVPYLTLHAGFLEDDDPRQARRVCERLACLADSAGAQGLTLLLETGQESAASLRELLEQLGHPALGVNFDPANMILYGKGDPVEAVRTLGPWIRHVHVKDAVHAARPGIWGAEVPWGEGHVEATSFLDALASIGFAGTLAVERESGDDRLGDIRRAIGCLTRDGIPP